MAAEQAFVTSDCPASPVNDWSSNLSSSSSRARSSDRAFAETSSSRSSISYSDNDLFDNIKDENVRLRNFRSSLNFSLSPSQLSKIPPTILIPTIHTSVAYLRSVSTPDRQRDEDPAPSKFKVQPLQIYSLPSTGLCRAACRQDALKLYVQGDNWTKHDLKDASITNLSLATEFEVDGLLQEDSGLTTDETDSGRHEECDILQSVPSEFLTEAVLYYLSRLTGLRTSAEETRTTRPSNNSSPSAKTRPNTDAPVQNDTPCGKSTKGKEKTRGCDQRNNDDDDDDDEDNKSSNDSHNSKKRRTGITLGEWACHWGKIYPYLLNVRLRQADCLRKGYADLSKLKNHLKRDHYNLCPGCLVPFSEEPDVRDAHDAHGIRKAREAHVNKCSEVNEQVLWTVMQPDQAVAIGKRLPKRLPDQEDLQREINEWYRILYVAFPNTRVAISPWLDVTMAEMFLNLRQLIERGQSQEIIQDYLNHQTASLNTVLTGPQIQDFSKIIELFVIQACLNSSMDLKMHQDLDLGPVDSSLPPPQSTTGSNRLSSTTVPSTNTPSFAGPSSGTSVTTNTDHAEKFQSPVDPPTVGADHAIDPPHQAFVGMGSMHPEDMASYSGDLYINGDGCRSKQNEDSETDPPYASKFAPRIIDRGTDP